MQTFKSSGLAQRFAMHAAVYNAFDTHLISRRGLRILRAQAHAAWAEATKAPERSGAGACLACVPPGSLNLSVAVSPYLDPLRFPPDGRVGTDSDRQSFV